MSNSTITPTTPIFRIFNGTERVATAILVGPRSTPPQLLQFLQIKPFRKLYQNQAEWMTAVMGTLNGALISMTREDKPRPKPWHLMTNEERDAHCKLRAQRARDRADARAKAKAAKIIAMRAAETPTIRSIRAIYDSHGMNDTLTMRGGRKLLNPGVFLLSKGTLTPVYFNRKTGLASCLGMKTTTEIPDLNNVSFFISTSKSTGSMKRVKPDLSVPNPNDRNILYISNNYTMSKTDEESVSKLVAKGFKVKVVVSRGRAWYSYINEYMYDPAFYEVMIGNYSYSAATPARMVWYKNIVKTNPYGASNSGTLDEWLAKYGAPAPSLSAS